MEKATNKPCLYYDIEASGRRMKELRNKKHYTQERLSEKLGMSLQGYKMIELGINGAKIDTLVIIAQRLNTTVDYLVTGRNIVACDNEEAM
ncbi:helix-turn-helix domain-containing protein [Eubacterium sp.]|uniref:helix-turn-helix domain-containing protein n=1 Tax=Eubacterium sp. TaxID=142586 RepID=UPI0039A3DE43